MQTRFPTIVLLAVSWVALSEWSLGQDISSAHSILRDSQRNVAKIGRLLKASEPNDPKRKHYLAETASILERLKAAQTQLAKMEDGLLDDFKTNFANLQSRDDLVWRVAPRSKPLLAELPADVEIQSSPKAVVIKKEKRRGSGGLSYHVCPEVALEEGDRVSVAFSTPVKSARGGTPVPYFGLRDEHGREQVLGSLGAFDGDGKTHTIFVQRVGNEGLAIMDGRFAVMQEIMPDQKLTPPIFLFFHMNDTAEIVVHSIQFGRAGESK